MRNLRDPMKKFTNYKSVYPYKQMLPAALNSEVSGKGGKRKQFHCLQEMSQMLVCLKKYEFDQPRCAKEIEAFQACNRTHQQSVAANKGQQPTVSGDGRLPTDVVNAQLKKYPQITKKKE